LKESIKGLKGNYSKVQEMRGVYFDWNKDYVKTAFKGSELDDTFNLPYFNNRSLGFIAQEIEKSVPTAVWTDASGHKTMEYGLIVAIAVGAIKEQQTRIDSIYERINRLKNLTSA
jgi:hypothetical protein